MSLLISEAGAKERTMLGGELVLNTALSNFSRSCPMKKQDRKYLLFTHPFMAAQPAFHIHGFQIHRFNPTWANMHRFSWSFPIQYSQQLFT